MPTVRLAVDVNGGDLTPKALINGVLRAVETCGDSLSVRLCGDRDKIVEALSQLQCTDDPLQYGLRIEHCNQVITCNETPSRVWKNKTDSSIVRCITLQKDGVVDASLSAGDTRILISASMFLLGREKGVSRPALAAFLPTTATRPSLLLDVGANIDCRVEHLVHFGMVGYNYVKKFFAIGSPTVRLLNIGAESSKGTKTILEASRILEKKCDGYRGFIEGDQVLTGNADVIVCDGFTGNILLKACESFYLLTKSVLKGDSELMDALKKKMAILNAENYGAAPLLGLKGIVLKAHGSSSSKAITHAVLAAYRAVKCKQT